MIERQKEKMKRFPNKRTPKSTKMLFNSKTIDFLSPLSGFKMKSKGLP